MGVINLAHGEFFILGAYTGVAASPAGRRAGVRLHLPDLPCLPDGGVRGRHRDHLLRVLSNGLRLEDPRDHPGRRDGLGAGDQHLAHVPQHVRPRVGARGPGRGADDAGDHGLARGRRELPGSLVLCRDPGRDRAARGRARGRDRGRRARDAALLPDLGDDRAGGGPGHRHHHHSLPPARAVRRMRSQPARLLFAAGVLVALALPPVAGKYYTELLSQALIFGIFAMSLDLLWGYAGVLNFGHAAYFGLGGYLVALLAREVRGFDPSYLGYALSVLAPAGLAGALGYFLFYSHVTGVYFTIITLVVTMIFQLIVSDWYWLGGMNGLLGVPGFVLRVWPGLGWELDSEVEVYYLLLSVSVLCYLFCRHVVRSPFGLVVAAINDNPEGADVDGNDTAYLANIMSL